MKKYLFLIPIILICFYANVFAASAPVIETANTITLKLNQFVDDVIPPAITTDDTATVTSYANVTILADVTGGASWNVTPYYSDGTTYYIGTLMFITQDTAFTVSTFGVDTMTVGVDVLTTVNSSNTITIKMIPYNQ